MTHPTTNSTQALIDANPFDGMLIDDISILKELEGRKKCPKCGKSRKFYCYTCYVPINDLQGHLPNVELPLKIDIIKHKYEIDGKSTSAHAAILASRDVNVYTYPDIPDYSGENVVLIFPSQRAFTISQLVQQDTYSSVVELKNIRKDIPKGHNESTLLKTIPKILELNIESVKNLTISKAVFIDSTWNQSRGIYKDERINRIPCVVLDNRISQFWRHQKGSPRWYLATIEAIHQFLLEIHVYSWGLRKEYTGIHNCFNEESLKNFELFYNDNNKSYNGQYDNLLYFFKYMYDLIHSYYQHEELYAYKRRLM